jgi:hypothetical protein
MTGTIFNGEHPHAEAARTPVAAAEYCMKEHTQIIEHVLVGTMPV